MTDQIPVKIAIADDHMVIRVGLKYYLKEHLNVTVYEAANGDELFKIANEHDINIVIMDINMPDTNTQGMIPLLLSVRPALDIIIFSVNKEEVYGKLYMGLGAKGFVNKQSDQKDILRAINCIMNGSVYMKPEMLAFYFNTKSNNNEYPYDKLSKKEMEVLQFLSKGTVLTEISKVLNLGISTISTHKARIYSKLGVKTSVELNELIKVYPLSK